MYRALRCLGPVVTCAGTALTLTPASPSSTSHLLRDEADGRAWGQAHIVRAGAGGCNTITVHFTEEDLPWAVAWRFWASPLDAAEYGIEAPVLAKYAVGNRYMCWLVLQASHTREATHSCLLAVRGRVGASFSV